ncbi:GAL4-like Zn(II)2Cys6 (or C6 zinc) binuclear cluster DNA-binding domain [Teratosphaeria destructans]|uniref:GAL4-like Zn(II)2Cys6 (Or C6 zinc) binuclear cluster DNA-binding domain n=1 Tax=Teratosphaeria destructans TaxID=418781 RepID=A0A9W7STY0_9PEZI|nr:GAL4-like Zn(II)2Cys6 (or C6 zinc) binuclear cluster DNA-binding domain [Teratosphaeria destructans]
MNPSSDFGIHNHHADAQYVNGSDTPPNAGAAPPSASAKINKGEHQRTYQACIPCRRRKVRCDLGSVDNPHDPPCVRCRRESKECYFSATRRKKKGGPGGDGAADEEGDEVYEIKAGKKRLRASQSIEVDGAADPDEYEDEPRTPGGSIGRSQPLRRPQAPKPKQYTEEDHKASEQVHSLLQSSTLNGGHDALNTMAAAVSMVDMRHSRALSGVQALPSFSGISPATMSSTVSPRIDRLVHPEVSASMPRTQPQDDVWKATLSQYPGIGAAAELLKTPQDLENYNSALKAWSRFRFVRAGWFTAAEGAAFVIYFYKYLNPLTPVCLPDYQAFELHERLLTEEPMLAVTILLVASRHMRMEGAGAISRPYAIHEKVWKYLQGMIGRVVWGQEQFGGGFCGAGAQGPPDSMPASDINPLNRKGLRTLGTVESLVLLTEWHPRAMHFPPEDSDEELMIPDQPITTPGLFDAESGKGIGGQRMDAWLEPCWRSDRMCWMLLGVATSLAFEIGVFDDSAWERHARATSLEPLDASGLNQYNKRRSNVKDILLVYVTSTSGRLGLTSMLPVEYSKPEDSQTMQKPTDQLESVKDVTLYFWLRMANLIRIGNNNIFRNKKFTRDLIKTLQYREAIDKIQAPMLQWRKDFDNAGRLIPPHMRCILQIEYEYCNVYINALSLQACAERFNTDHMPQILDPPIELARQAASQGLKQDATTTLAPQTLQRMMGPDRRYFSNVRSSAIALLRIVTDGLTPGEYLRHAPVRTYFRIISVAIMLLKSFTLGASETEVAESLSLLEKTIEALKTCIVDDVHVAARFAELLLKLTEGLKPRLIRISNGNSRSRGVSNHNTPAPPQLQMANQALQAHQQQRTPQQAAPGASMHAQAQQPQWNYNSNYLTSSSRSSMAPNNPLLGVTNNTYDLADNDVSVMPPPSYNFSPTTANTATTNGGTNGAVGSGYYEAQNGEWASNNDDWLAFALDPLINVHGEVDSTMLGPSIGGNDMLELLMHDVGGHQNGF